MFFEVKSFINQVNNLLDLGIDTDNEGTEKCKQILQVFNKCYRDMFLRVDDNKLKIEIEFKDGKCNLQEVLDKQAKISWNGCLLDVYWLKQNGNFVKFHLNNTTIYADIQGKATAFVKSYDYKEFPLSFSIDIKNMSMYDALVCSLAYEMALIYGMADEANIYKAKYETAIYNATRDNKLRRIKERRFI